MVFPPGRVALPVNQPADRIHAQAVKVEFLQPVLGGGLQEAAHLPPGVHEVAAAPLADAHVAVGVLVQGRAVVLPQGVVVHGKVDGHKIQQHPHALLVAAVHKGLQLPGAAVAGGGAEEPRVLIAPGRVAGVLA